MDLWANDGPASTLNNSWACSQTNQLPECKYEDEIFVEEVLARIAAHDVTQPFFLFWAPHIAHEPLQVPRAYVEKFAWIDTRPRQLYMAMINYVDTLIGRVVSALKAKGMWDDLLWLSSADNGVRCACGSSPHPPAPSLMPPSPPHTLRAGPNI